MLCYVRATELKVEKNVTKKTKKQLLQQSLLWCANVSAELVKAEEHREYGSASIFI